VTGSPDYCGGGAGNTFSGGSAGGGGSGGSSMGNSGTGGASGVNMNCSYQTGMRALTRPRFRGAGVSDH
jgi:hypothetical protein